MSRPRITVLTLGVDDLERAGAFYRDDLGLATDGSIGQESLGAWRRAQDLPLAGGALRYGRFLVGRDEGAADTVGLIAF